MQHAWEKRNAYRILKDKIDSKGLFGRPMGRYKDNIRMDVKGKVCELD